MKWPAALSANLKRLLPFACRDDTPNYPKASGADCPTAKPMRLTPSPDVTELLHRRALVQSNRNRDQAERYLRLHMTLAKGRCFNA
jgi:hypothetical protein